MIFEDVQVQRAERILPGRPSGRMQRTRSATSVAGEMLTGTRLIKDWENARDLQGRGQRLVAHRMRRTSDKDGAHYAGASVDGPFVRGPCSEPLEGAPESLSWHEQQVASIFRKLDVKGLGQVSLDKLQESFETMCVPIDQDMFSRYSRGLLAEGVTSVNSAQFLAFHKAVWVNQPRAVQHRAGFPRAFAGYSGVEVELDRPRSASPPSPTNRMKKSATAPLSAPPPAARPTGIPGVRDVKDVEGQLRRAYRKHASPESGHLEYAKLPLVLQDLGLDSSDFSEVEGQARSLFNVADSNKDGVLSFHEFVEFQNRYVASLETLRNG